MFPVIPETVLAKYSPITLLLPRAHPFVDIHLSIRKRLLEFVVKNSTDAFPEGSGSQEHIGLSNLRRQLELLYSDYKLSVQQGKSIQQGESVFTAILQINLASHV